MLNQSIKLTAFLFALLLALPTQAGDVLDQLKQCAKTEDDAARAACYEALGKQVLANEAAETSEASAAVVVKDSAGEPAPTDDGAPPALPDTAGGGKFNQGAEQYSEEYVAELTRCQRASDRKWFYVFANGQIWKQVDKRRLNHRDCSGQVDIVRDGFGYKVQIEGVKGFVRIRRYK